ncbi:cisplatin damage response ATP-dependent DNA ligase [Roseitalea porphyridii]|uniref:DNA ligase (ATP) n=1 Tax=Roseitalea porphyridii TaxID=1852022 RepID=A0A4P6UX93_9HYPH|nr:cisplatin damage response ATP-dependent DNA ligase [Roseitalea porphyridii]QBK29435.1 cisplatin damage response ATP-dependent DNA ligase [Roseitalea porphyridii]
MKPFAELLDRLVLTPSRNAKLRLIVDYVAATPDPDRGYAIAAITRDLDIPSVKPAMIRALVEERVDPVLFGYSYDFVGDLAETVSLIWPAPTPHPSPASVGGGTSTSLPAAPDPAPGAERLEGASAQASSLPRLRGRDDGWGLSLGEVVETLQRSSRSDGPRLVERWLDALDPPGRYALLKLITGGMRVGVSSRLIKQALADYGQKDVTEIEELWHGLAIPYTDLFAWLDGAADKPESAAAAPFRPVMLANPTDLDELARYDPADYLAEWKWDGIRVQATAEQGVARIYSRTGDDISHAFPDLLAAMSFDGAIDGELLVGHYQDGAIRVGTFGDLQQRLNRKTVSAKQQAKFPAFVRAYDLLQEGEEDLRALPFADRRARLEQFVADLPADRFDMSALVPFSTWDEIGRMRNAAPEPVIEGLMLKRRDSAYVPGRPKGPWFKYKRDPFLIDAVLMYAQRGHGKRSSFYSDYTFGVWTGAVDDPALVPVGKAYFGFTDAELKQIDKYVRDNTIERFGPVRSVRAEPDHGLVLEIAFEGLNRSARHKSGVAMRFPRIARLRWDKPPHEADRLEALEAMLEDRK